MTTKHTKEKDLTSLDVDMPVPSNQHTDLLLPNDTENRWTKDDLAAILSGSNPTNSTSKITKSARPKVEILRASSPTLKRLIAVRYKLDKYATSLAKLTSNSRQSLHDTSLTSNHEKQPTTNARIPSSSQKRIKSQKSVDSGPLDKITYEKTPAHNGNVKKKCSLEIWLPKAGPDDDDEDTGNISQTATLDPKIIDKQSQSPPSMSVRSRRPSTIKIVTIIGTETKSPDEIPLKKTESTVVPRVYHYEDYLSDQPEERPHSSKSNNTAKSDGNGLNKNAKRQRTRPHTRRLSPTTNQTDETVHSVRTSLPMSSKNLLANIKQVHSAHETKGTSGSSNTSTINDLMIKYSMIKKNHQELTQTKLQLEKPPRDSKYSPRTSSKDHSLPSPPASDSASHVSSDPPAVSVKKLLGDASPPRSAGDPNNATTKILDHRSAHRKPLYSEILPQTRLLSIVNHLQHRQTSASMSIALLPPVIGKKTDDPFRSLERSKTFDVAFDVSIDNPKKIPSRLPAQPDSLEHAPKLSQRITSGNEQLPPRISKRSLPPPLLPFRSEQQQQQQEQQQQQQQQVTQPLVQLVQYQNVQNSAQRYHHSAHTTTTGGSTNKVLVHLKYSNSGNTDRNCLVPE